MAVEESEVEVTLETKHKNIQALLAKWKLMVCRLQIDGLLFTLRTILFHTFCAGASFR